MTTTGVYMRTEHAKRVATKDEAAAALARKGWQLVVGTTMLYNGQIVPLYVAHSPRDEASQSALTLAELVRRCYYIEDEVEGMAAYRRKVKHG